MTADVPRQNFYGFASDYLETDTDIGTIALEHMISESVRVDARFRYASYGRQSRITEPLIMQPVPPGTALPDVICSAAISSSCASSCLNYFAKQFSLLQHML